MNEMVKRMISPKMSYNNEYKVMLFGNTCI